MTAADKWEVVRIYGDDRTNIVSTHKTVELAEAAFAAATANDTFYAVDVSYLPGGRRLDFEPLFGIANGCRWVASGEGCAWADRSLNEFTR